MTDHAPNRTTYGRKQRQAIFDRWRVEIIRNSSDQLALEQVRQRAIHDPQVRSDSEIMRWVEQCVSERSREIAGNRPQRPDAAEQARFARTTQFGAYEPSHEDVLNVVCHLRLQAQEQLSREDEIAAGFTLNRLTALQQRYPDVVDASIVRSLTDAHKALGARRLTIAREIEIAAKRAVDAAFIGNHDVAAAAMRQIAAHHIAHPDILNDDAMDAIRQRVTLAAAHHQHEDAAVELMRREKEVTSELRALRSAIREFRHTARTTPHDSKDYQLAEKSYRKAVHEVRHHDREWLAGTILELVTLLDDWEDHPPSIDKQVDAFVNTLKSTLRKLHSDIRSAELSRRNA
ncbi:MAG: hypothetical protein H6819_10760 [Phycisphaerales bacterium]|nr:hypothetical protein [Phycisphaerales bacterium]MCB9854373.1 hypothetical protein [Phycisphaerales bacterium]MCB9863574.1 hypothetical protein [Phycisphaerales bacterium]